MSRFEAFSKNCRGNVVIIFSLVLFPLIGIIGLATDYARLHHIRGQFQSALDSTTIMLTRYAAKNDVAALERIALPHLNASLQQYRITPVSTLKVEKTTDRVSVKASGSMIPGFGPLFGISQWSFDTKVEASYGTRKIEVALVLDNTGSMADLNKIGELKKASHTLLNILRDAAATPGQVRVALVPYTTRVNLGTSLRNSPLLTNTPTGAAPMPNPWYPMNAYNVPATRSAWDGCVADRDDPYHRGATPASPAVGASLYPMIQCGGALAQVMPLSSNFSALHARVDQMTAVGATNITLGAQWGLEMLSANAPFTETGSGANVERFMILLTDGQNTVDRWAGVKEAYGAPAAETRMNRDTQAMCDAIVERSTPEANKTLKIKLYTVLVIDGNEPLLRNCASSPDLYRKVQQANQLESVFRAIANEIGRVSLTM